MNNFRLSNKKIYNDSRSSIENLHNQKMELILKKQEDLPKKKNKLKFLNDKLIILKNSEKPNRNSIFEINEQIKKLTIEIEKVEGNHELVDYIDKAWEFLHDFKDNLEKETEDVSEEQLLNNDYSNNYDNNDNDKTDDNKNSGILKFVSSKGKTSKGEEYNRYYQKCIMNINCPQVGKTSSNNYCKTCNSRKFEIDSKNGLIICTTCGVCETYYENTSASINFSDTSHIQPISQPFSYQRKNHFREWLNQLQGKEVTVIPESVVNLVLVEIKKERITNIDDITSDRVKKYLKKLRLNKYYEHIPNLISKITKKPPLIITSDLEEVLLELFDKIQEPFKKYCPDGRKNFLSYSYTLHKFCLLLGKDEFLIYFPLLKSREKLFEQEKIWKGICSDLGWKFMPSI